MRQAGGCGGLQLGFLAILLGAAPCVGASAADEVLAEGPWGHVEVVPVRIRLPLSMVLAPDVQLPVQPWSVQLGREETARLLDELGVEFSVTERLLSTYNGSGGGALRPTAETIRDIDSVTRTRLYEALRRVPANTAQRNPHRFRRQSLGERFRDLAPASVDLLRRFFYESPSMPQSVLLADLPAVVQLTQDKTERGRIIQAVSENDSLVLRLKLDSTSDPAALADYWGRGGRRRDLEILIGSVMEGAASPHQIDAIYLLPPFPRIYLLTYPRLENASRRDCFWTALNFFLPVPDDELAGATLAQTMVDGYELVKGPLQLGDMLVLFRPTGEPEHAAIFIAGDIYFTKNGNNLAMPWLLMPLEDILERYDEAERAPLTHYRLKKLD